MEQLLKLETWFKKYLSAFYGRDIEKNQIFQLKEEHTKRVCNNILWLGKAMHLSDNGTTCSKKIIRSIHKKETAQTSEVNCLTDLKLLQISWAYDLNFPESYRLLKKHCYIEELACTLPQTKEVKTAVSLVIKHIDRMTGKNC